MSTTMRTVSCPHCSARVKTAAAPDKPVRCPKCQATFRATSDAPQPLAPRIVCSACQAKLSLKSVTPGMKFKCPKCGAIERVPAATKKPVPKRVQPAPEPELSGSPEANDEAIEAAPAKPSMSAASSRTRPRRADEGDDSGWSISGKSLGVGFLVIVLGGIVLGVGVGAWSFFQGPPRSAAEIVKERERLPILFLTEKSRQRVIAPGDKLMIVDPKTKELCWPAHECTNPDCPGKTGDAPVLFIHQLDLGYFVKDDGGIGFDAEKSAATPQYHGCPECVKIRQLGKETPAQQALYNTYDKRYELPETAARRARLDKELKQVMAADPGKKK